MPVGRSHWAQAILRRLQPFFSFIKATDQHEAAAANNAPVRVRSDQFFWHSVEPSEQRANFAAIPQGILDLIHEPEGKLVLLRLQRIVNGAFQVPILFEPGRSPQV